MIKFARLRTNTCSYLIGDGSKDKKAKSTKKCVIKRKLKFQGYKNCLDAIQLENKKSYIEKNIIDIDSIKENHYKFTKNNKSILKIQ